MAIVFYCAAWASGAVAQERYIPFMLGDTLITISTYDSEGAVGYTYVNLHENESTSINAARRVISSEGGRLVCILHGGSRNISFSIGQESYAFDPNRIFSNSGIEATLRAVGGTYSAEAHMFVSLFAEKIKSTLSLSGIRGGLLVALHNNTNQNYSLQSYVDGGSESAAMASMYYGDGDPDDFFLVTDSGVFEQIKEGGFNVVLQSSSAPDDGSLSVYASHNGVRYVNVEAEHGHLSAQMEMLNFLSSMN